MADVKLSKSPKSPKSWKTVEVMTQCKYLDEETILTALDHRAVKDFAYIKHDKDTDVDGSLKSPHWHIMIRFDNPVPTTSICNWFGVKSNFLEHIKGRFADALEYLTHANKPDKYQYSDDEVKSNFDFKAEIEKTKKEKITEDRKNEIIDGIVKGTIREYNYTKYISAFEYVKLKKIVDDSFRYRKDMLQMDKNRNLQCLYFTGGSGTGKTTYAKYFCDQKGLSYYVSSGSNDLFDGYKGEDVVILDDIRGIHHNVSDILKILDNNTSSSVRSRYQNKFLECQYIIITSVQPPNKFFDSMVSQNNESMVQFKRRCKILAEFTPDFIYWYNYNDVSQQYDFYNKSYNFVPEKYKRSSADELMSVLDGVILFDNEDLPFN